MSLFYVCIVVLCLLVLCVYSGSMCPGSVQVNLGDLSKRLGLGSGNLRFADEAAMLEKLKVSSHTQKLPHFMQFCWPCFMYPLVVNISNASLLNGGV